jgi:hypothetical protein
VLSKIDLKGGGILRPKVEGCDFLGAIERLGGRVAL